VEISCEKADVLLRRFMELEKPIAEKIMEMGEREND
jgi:hypothetical protein